MGLLLELVDLFKLLQEQLDKKSALDQRFFSNYVTPVWENFTKIHDDYLSTFGNYICYASKANFDIGSLIENIRRDSIASSNLRVDLNNHLAAINSSKNHSWGRARFSFEEFTEEIQIYFSLSEYLPFAFNRSNENEWLIMVTGAGGYNGSSYDDMLYEDHPVLWRVSKGNIEGIKALYQKALENSKQKIYLSECIPKHITDNRDDFYFIDISNTPTKIREDEKILSEWCHEVLDALSDPNSNAPRTVVLSFLVLSRDTGTEMAPKLLKSTLSLLQDHYNAVSKSYYELRIELLG